MHAPSQHEVETFSGLFVDTNNPDPSTILLKDIAHALSNTCRFGGHCDGFYSVAEHSVFCSVRIQRKGGTKTDALAALHHDDAEAYLGDIPRPMKPLLGEAYKRLTDKMDAAIVQGLELPFGVEALHDPAVKDVDVWALLVEARHLLPSGGRHWFNGDQGAHAWGIEDQPTRIVVPEYWHGGLKPSKAEKLYLDRHKELTA